MLERLAEPGLDAELGSTLDSAHMFLRDLERRSEGGLGSPDSFPEAFAIATSLIVEIGQSRQESGAKPADPRLQEVRAEAAHASALLLQGRFWEPVREEIAQHLLPLLAEAPPRGYSHRVGLLTAVFERLHNLGDHTAEHQVRRLSRRAYGYKFPRFGTSGIRGVWGRDITRARAEAVTQALCDFLGRDGTPARGHLVVGYDSRLHADELAQWVTDILLANGFDVHLSAEPLPTPVLNYWGTRVAHDGLRGIIMCTASHNPPEWHGIKFTPVTGLPATATITDWVGSQANRILLARGLGGGDGSTPVPSRGALRRFEARSAYVEWVLSPDRPLALNADRIREWFHDKLVVVDEMHGAGAGYLGPVLDRLGVPHAVVHGTASPTFGRLAYPAPEPPHTSESQELVERLGAQLGLAMDADADRFGVIDAGGRFVHPSQVVAILTDFLVNERRSPGKIVRSLTCSTAVDDVLRHHLDAGRTLVPAAEAVPAFLRGASQVVTRGSLATMTGGPSFVTMVGIKYLMEAGRMDPDYRVPPGTTASNFVIAGEESGGITTAGHVNDKDGVWANLVVLDAMAHYRSSFESVWKKIVRDSGHEWHMGRVDLDGSEEVKDRLVHHFLYTVPETAELPSGLEGLSLSYVGGIPHDYVELRVERGSTLVARLIVRGSGTEPICRVYSEAIDPSVRETLERWVIAEYDRLGSAFLVGCTSPWRLVELLLCTLPTPATQRAVDQLLESLGTTLPSVRQGIVFELGRLGALSDTRKREVAHLWIPLLARGTPAASASGLSRPRGVEGYAGFVFDLDGTLGDTDRENEVAVETAELLAGLLRTGHRVAVVTNAQMEGSRGAGRKLVSGLRRAVNSKDRASLPGHFVLYADGGGRKFTLDSRAKPVESTDYGGDAVISPPEAAIIRSCIERALGEIPPIGGSPRRSSAVTVTTGSVQVGGLGSGRRDGFIAALGTELSSAGLGTRFAARSSGEAHVVVTRAGVSKEQAVRHLLASWNLPADRVVYFGDEFYPGGGDEPLVGIGGLRCLAVNSPDHRWTITSGVPYLGSGAAAVRTAFRPLLAGPAAHRD
ncbi:MAG: hypothetical protein L3K17_07380 [Thermoplasmata archaeon]|nr:hypothetical protein [Thermoplasmata archaeon]